MSRERDDRIRCDLCGEVAARYPHGAKGWDRDVMTFDLKVRGEEVFIAWPIEVDVCEVCQQRPARDVLAAAQAKVPKKGPPQSGA